MGWEERIIPSGVQEVTGARIKFYNSVGAPLQSGYVHEFEAWEATTGDVNTILRAYLGTALAGEAWGTRIYCPRLPEKTTLPALGFFVRGGLSTPYIPRLVDPSFQFDCWGNNPIEARSVYIALYDALQGIENQAVAVGLDTYYIKSAEEEVQGMDIQDVENPSYHRVITFFRIKIRI